MSEDSDRDDIGGRPPAPDEPSDPSTREFGAVPPPEDAETEEHLPDPGRPFEPPPPEEAPWLHEEADLDEVREAAQRRASERRERVGFTMDTETFMAIPAPSPRTTFEPPEFDRREGRLGLSTAFFSIATAASRVAGLVREIVAAGYFGVTGPMSAFTIAFQVPNLVRSLFADAAIQAAFVPVFTEQLEKGNKKEAFRLASTLLFGVTMALGAITALFVLLAPVIIPIFAPGFEGELQDLTVTLAQLLFPILVMLGATGMVVGVLNSYDRFAAFAISPFFWNVAIIAVLVALAPQFDEDDRIYAYAIGVLVGTVIQLAIPAWDLRNTEYRFSFDFDWRMPEVRRVLLLMLPVTISLGLINFNLVINSFFGTLVSDQAPAAIDKAFRIYMLPQGIFSVAIATVVFPTLARFAAREEYDQLRATMANGMRQILLMLVPAAAAILVLSEPMTRLIYQRGEFDAAQTEIVAQALFWFSFSLPFNGLFLLMTRTFFSLQRPWVPTAISGANLVITAIVALALYGPFGVGGIVAATAVATAASVAAQAVILRGRLHGIELGRFIDAAVRITAAAALLAGVSYVVWLGLDDMLGRSVIAQIVSLGVALAAGGAAYFAAVTALRVPEAEQVRRLVRRA
ncbi:MAG TPA: murein biosynthesis integral membrane protein MurJ, partial [Solirubrobacterales bacterium]|nr:murein biosynthesis integral membrane protein MurJ [Solirubrobacterales bacterium]